MSDLIDRQAAIDATEIFIKDCNPEHFVGHPNFIEYMGSVGIKSFGSWQYANGFNMGLTAAEVVIKKLPSAQPEPHWIPCSERLPEEKINQNTKDFEKVLCTTAFDDVRAYAFGTPIGTKEPHFWNGPECVDKYVVAWQYMPEPYQEESEESDE